MKKPIIFLPKVFQLISKNYLERKALFNALMFVILICYTSGMQAQGLLKYVNANLVPSGKAPSWFEELKSDRVNVNEIEEEMEEYLIKKYGNELDLEDEEALEEANIYEPHVFAFKKWRRNVSFAIDAKGYVSVAALSKPQSTKSVKPSLERVAAASSWTAVGPLDIYSTANDGNQRRVPSIGNIFKIEASKSNPSIVYCLSETNNIFKSIDKGLHWTSLAQNYAFGNAREAIAIHPTNPNIVFVGESNEIHKTTDGGTTWSLAYTAPDMNVNELEFAEGNPSLIVASSSNGIYRSADGGLTWTRKTTRKTYDIAFKPGSNTVIYAVSENPSTFGLDFVKSTDGGANFTTTTIGSGWDNGITDGALIGVSPADPNRIYVANLVSGLSLFKSLNEGSTWTIGATTASEGSNPLDWAGFVRAQGYYDFAITVSATNANELIIGTGSTRKSIDGGLTFPICIGGYCSSSFPMHADLQDAYTNGTDTYLATDGGVVYSSDFFVANGEARIVGLNASDFWHMDQGWDEDVLVGGRYHNGNALLYEAYGGTSLYLGGAEEPTGWILHGQKRKLTTVDIGNLVYPATLSTPTTYFTYNKQPNKDGYGSESSEILIEPRYFNHHYVGYENELWETWDGGKGFKSIKTFPDRVRKMEIGRNDSKVLYVAVQNNAFLHKSIDEGKTWTIFALPSNWLGNRVDLALDPLDAQHIWASDYNATAGFQVYESTTGGQTWVNKTTAVLSNKRIYNIRFAGGTTNGVYITTDEQFDRNGNQVKSLAVFYRDASMTDWQNFSTGLPSYNLNAQRSHIFYRDAKLRTATNNGIWETPLFDVNYKPIAQPSVDKKSATCSAVDTFYFYDYSILKYAGASRVWSFSPAPLYISSTTAHSPKVVFGSNGKYSVTLTVTDANGNVSTKTIADMIDIQPLVEKQLDSLAGKALSLNGVSQNAVISPLNVAATNTVTYMAWVKADGLQDEYDGIVMSTNGATGNSFGMQVKSNGSVGYEWNSQYYWIASSQALPSNQWAHVAVVITPTSGTVYMNGNVILSNIDAHTALYNFGDDITIGSHGNGRYFKGLIDEVAIYNKSLTQKEIREQMHLTKKPSLEPNLKGYFQFNESEMTIYNKVGGCVSSFLNANKVTSTAPVGGGISYTVSVTSGGVKTFSGSTAYPLGNTGLNLSFPGSGTYPNGDVVATKLNVAPDVLPTIARVSPSYWIVNNFGTNVSTIATLTFLQFYNAGPVQAGDVATLSSIKLFYRGTFAEGATWGSSKDNADAATAGSNGSVTFSTNNGVNALSKQFIVGFQNAITNVAPTVSISSPANNASFTAPASITINATAADADGTVSTVQFYNGATLLGSDNTSPYSYAWTGVAAGSYSITAKATDNLGAVTTSTAVSVTVTSGNVAPTVSISSPVSNASFTAPASITINATAADADGTVSTVQFYNGATLLGSDNTSPYSYAWTGVAAGSYSITAKATDNASAITTSTAVAVTVTNSTANIAGADCGANNTILLYSLNSSLRTNATSYNWYYTGTAQNITPVTGATYSANLSTGASFAAGQVCVGVNYSVAPWYASYCKSVSVCSGRGEEVEENTMSSITPNPSSGSFTLSLPNPAQFVRVTNVSGKEVYNVSNVKDVLSFGNQWPQGMYIVTISYDNGKLETYKIEKIK